MYQELEGNSFYIDLSIIKTEPTILSLQQQQQQQSQQLLLTESFQPSCTKQQDVFFLDDFEYLYNPMLDFSTIINSDYTGIMEYNYGDNNSSTTSSPSSMSSLLENDFCFFPFSSPSSPHIEQPLQQQEVCITSKEKLPPCQHKKKSNNHHQSTMVIPLHSQQKNRIFACHLCSRQFARKHDLQRHIRVHTGVKPYSCLNCSKSFVRTDALKRHLRLDENCKKSPIIQAMAKSGNRRYQNL